MLGGKLYKIQYVVILLFLIFTRLFLLDIVPVGLVHDETVYAIQAKSFAVQGKTLNQEQSWWSLQPVDPMYAELPSVMMAPAFWVTANNLLASHLSSAVLGILFPFIFAWLIYGIWQNKTLALIAGYVAAFNPFYWQFSRLGYDSFFSVFFYLLGAAILVNTKNWYTLTSLPVFFLGFFQYQGLKLVLIPWVAGIIALKYFESNVTTSFSLVSIKNIFFSRSNIFLNGILLSVVLLTLFYGLVLLPQQNLNDRTKFTIFSDKTISNQVNTDRRLSIDSPVSGILINKAINIAEFMAVRLARSFSPELLFLKGEPVSTFAVRTHGIFYLLDILLMAAGIYFLITKKKGLIVIFILIPMTIVMATPSLINTMSEWYFIRMHLSYLILLFFISWGGYWIFQKKNIRLIFFVIYLGGVVAFGYQYFFRYPILSADRANIAERVIAKYSSLVDPHTQIIVRTGAPEFLFFNYLLYSNNLNESTVEEISSQLQSIKNQSARRLKIKNVTFTNECIPEAVEAVTISDIQFSVCDRTSLDSFNNTIASSSAKQSLVIPSILDSGERYRITGDTLCHQYKQSTFINIKSLKQFDMGKMSAQEFCTTWITDLNQL